MNNLYTGVADTDIPGMDWGPSAQEVAAWRNQEHIAYWKSRALSLELENRMLVQHLRNIYAKETLEYENIMKNQEKQQHIEDAPRAHRNKEQQAEETVETKAPTVLNDSKRRRAEMEKLFGGKAAKIMAMETAVQLNYDLRLAETGNVPYWPHTPLNFKFE